MARIVLEAERYKQLVCGVMLRDKYRCRLCGRSSGLHAHHIIFRSASGDDALYNLITLCFLCHDAVHTKKLVIEPMDGTVPPIDANGPVCFIFKKGWRPGNNT